MKKLLYPLALASTLALAACGGGSNNDSLTDKNSEPSPTVSTVYVMESEAPSSAPASTSAPAAESAAPTMAPSSAAPVQEVARPAEAPVQAVPEASTNSDQQTYGNSDLSQNPSLAAQAIYYGTQSTFQSSYAEDYMYLQFITHQTRALGIDPAWYGENGSVNGPENCYILAKGYIGCDTGVGYQVIFENSLNTPLIGVVKNSGGPVPASISNKLSYRGRKPFSQYPVRMEKGTYDAWVAYDVR